MTVSHCGFLKIYFTVLQKACLHWFNCFYNLYWCYTGKVHDCCDCQDLLGPAGLSARFILADKPAGPLNCVFTAVIILLAVCISSKKTVF